MLVFAVISATGGLIPVLRSEWRWVNRSNWEGGWWFYVVTLSRWEREPKARESIATCADYSTLRQERKIVGPPNQL